MGATAAPPPTAILNSSSSCPCGLSRRKRRCGSAAASCAPAVAAWQHPVPHWREARVRRVLRPLTCSSGGCSSPWCCTGR